MSSCMTYLQGLLLWLYHSVLCILAYIIIHIAGGHFNVAASTDQFHICAALLGDHIDAVKRNTTHQKAVTLSFLYNTGLLFSLFYLLITFYCLFTILVWSINYSWHFVMSFELKICKHTQKNLEVILITSYLPLIHLNSHTFKWSLSVKWDIIVKDYRPILSILPECQVKGFEDISASIIVFCIQHQLAQTLIHDRIKEGQVMEADWSPKDILKDMTVQVDGTQFILQQTQPKKSVRIKRFEYTVFNKTINFMWPIHHVLLKRVRWWTMAYKC